MIHSLKVKDLQVINLRRHLLLQIAVHIQKKTCSECEYVEFVGAEEVSHDWGEEVYEHIADCDTEGFTYHVCNTCGEIEIIKTIPATGHIFGVWKTTQKATCGNDGEKERECEKCGKTETMTVKAASQTHNWVTVVIKAATCTDPGTTVVRFSNCYEIEPDSEKEIPAKGHSWKDVAGTDTSTCLQDGTKQQKCSSCGATQTVEVKAAGEHKWQGELVKAATCKQEGEMLYTCTVCGEQYTDYIEKLPHTLPERKNCSDSVKCIVCGETVQGGEHTFGTYSYNADGHWRICDVCGYREASVPHDPDNDANCKTSYTCQCGYVVPAQNHIFTGKSKIESDGTYHWYTCGREGCNQPISKNAHRGGTATCTNGAICTFCGTEYGAKDPDNHVNNNFTVVGAKEATLDEEGYTGNKVCLDCGEVMEYGQTIPRLEKECEHVWGDLQRDDDGHWRVCTKCGVMENSEKEAHNYSNEYSSDAMTHWLTCTECGYMRNEAHTPADDDGDCTTAVNCTVCGAVVVEAQEHDFTGGYASDAEGHWHVCVNVGCVQTDTKTAHSGGTANCISKAYCDVCGNEYGEIDPANHIGGTGIRGQLDATEFNDGYTGDELCLGCNTTLKQRTV